MKMVYKPTMREKKRYILFEVRAEGAVGEREAQFASPANAHFCEAKIAREAVYNGILKFLGEYGSSLASPKVLEFDEKTGRGVLRCARDEVSNVKAALALMNSIAGKKAAVRALGVSGTIKKLKGKRNAREESL